MTAQRLILYIFADSADLQFSVTRHKNFTKVINFKQAYQLRRVHVSYKMSILQTSS